MTDKTQRSIVSVIAVALLAPLFAGGAAAADGLPPENARGVYGVDVGETRSFPAPSLDPDLVFIEGEAVIVDTIQAGVLHVLIDVRCDAAPGDVCMGYIVDNAS